MAAVTPLVSLTLQWQAPMDNGCLPIVSYVLNKNGVDLSAEFISSDADSFTDTAMTGAAIGTQITYKLKAVNQAGASSYTEPLTVTVGVVPNAPSSLLILS